MHVRWLDGVELCLGWFQDLNHVQDVCTGWSAGYLLYCRQFGLVGLFFAIFAILPHVSAFYAWTFWLMLMLTHALSWSARLIWLILGQLLKDASFTQPCPALVFFDLGLPRSRLPSCGSLSQIIRVSHCREHSVSEIVLVLELHQPLILSNAELDFVHLVLRIRGWRAFLFGFIVVITVKHLDNLLWALSFCALQCLDLAVEVSEVNVYEVKPYTDPVPDSVQLVLLVRHWFLLLFVFRSFRIVFMLNLQLTPRLTL